MNRHSLNRAGLPALRTAILAWVASVSALAAQNLQLVTQNLDPVPDHNSYFGGGGLGYIPSGPVAFPRLISLGPFGHLNLRDTPTSVTVDAESFSGPSFSVVTGSQVDLVTYVTKPAPARITLQVQSQVSVQQTFPQPSLFDCGVDLDADGSDEFANTTTSSASATLTMWCDDVGAPVRWHQHNEGLYATLGQTVNSSLTLQFSDPVQEQTYGPACAGKLGCQSGGAPFERIFVASLPEDVVYAWLMGGDAQWNVTFPGFACPLLVEPQFVLAVPTFAGPNGRRYVDFEATFPPIPGLTFYAQGIAVSNNTFLGTNGVIIRT